MILDVEPRHLKLIMGILKKHLPLGAKVYAFGSRAKNCAKQYSDLDLAIDINGDKLDFSTESKLKSDFENSLIPYTLDVVDLNSISESFRNNIKNDLIELTNLSA